MKTEKLFISFAVKIDETVRFSCRTTSNNNIADKEIFRVNGYYFFYVFNRTEKVNTYSLREITEKEFYARRSEFLKLRPHKAVSEWTDGKNKFSVKNYYNGTWKRNVPAADCIFLSEDNPLKEIHDAVVSEASVRRLKLTTGKKSTNTPANAAAWDENWALPMSTSCVSALKKASS